MEKENKHYGFHSNGKSLKLKTFVAKKGTWLYKLLCPYVRHIKAFDLLPINADLQSKSQMI